jgi:hypothetical protein
MGLNAEAMALYDFHIQQLKEGARRPMGLCRTADDPAQWRPGINVSPTAVLALNARNAFSPTR